MKKLALLSFIISLLLPVVSGNTSEKMMVFSYEKPYKYELINGSYKVQAVAEGLRSAKGVEVHFNGEVLRLQEIENEGF